MKPFPQSTWRVATTLILLLIGFSTSVSCEEKTTQDLTIPNPYLNAKPGQWMKWKITTTLPNGKKVSGGILKKEVIKKTESEVVLTIQVDLNGKLSTPTTETIQLTKPFQPFLIEEQTKVTVLKHTEEKIELHQKSFDCTVISIQEELEALGKPLTVIETIWLSKALPLDGLVKQVTQNQGGTVTEMIFVETSPTSESQVKP